MNIIFWIIRFCLLWLLLFGIYLLLAGIYDYLLLGLYQGYRWFISRIRPKSAFPPKSAFSDLQLQLQELAKIAWTIEKAFREPDFLLSWKAFVNITEPAQVVEVLMRHAKRITPAFQVLHMVPRVLVTPKRHRSSNCFIESIHKPFLEFLCHLP